MNTFDIIVIGAGIAGVSVAAHLAQSRKVAVFDMEERAAYHTTGRSAAMYEPNYGPPPMLAFTRASAEFFKSPPQGFAAAPLVTPRHSLFFMQEGQEQAADKLLSISAGLEEISEAKARELFPVLNKGYAKRSFLDPHTADMDVDLLHGGFMKLFKSRGGNLVLSARVTALSSGWTVETTQGRFHAPIVVNAAGAWGDHIAGLAGVTRVGLQPKRRSIGVIPMPAGTAFDNWPMVTDVGETWYAKPQSGKMMVSSADATPMEPHDAYADDMAIAEGIDRLMTATTIEVDRLEHSWGGLRTFAPDGNPVIGFDPSTDGFFWLVGQGGYGIQSAPSLSATAAALVLGQSVPDAVMSHGLNPDHIKPQRFRT